MKIVDNGPHLYETLWSGNFEKRDNSIQLNNSIDNYSAIVVAAKMYWISDTAGEQVVTMFIPNQLYYYASKNNASARATEFLLNASITSTNRRIYFGFDPATPTILYTGTVEGSSGHAPRLIGVYGIR